LVRTSEKGTWCERQDPSALWPLISFGAVQPLGVRSTIIGQLGSVALPLWRASDWMRRISAMAVSSVAAICWCMVSGSSPSTK
jgi:hypothetical protein